MSQKEIIHLSLGTYSNHISTHFWNQQQSYFDYSDDPQGLNADQEDTRPVPLVDHDVSFRAGIGYNGVETYTPRALIFDTLDQMGGLKRINDLYQNLHHLSHASNGDGNGDYDFIQSSLQDGLNTWSHPASLQRTAPPLPKSTYQRRLEAEDQGISYDSDEKLSDSDSDYEDEASPSTSTSNPNSNAIGNQRKRKSSSLIKEKEREKEFHFWSNYNKSFFHPNSILPIGGQLLSSMIGSTAETSYINSDQFQFPEEDGRNRFESWEFGVRTFDEVEKEAQILDNSLRFQAEDCDSLQSFQLISTINDSFSGFSFRMLEELQDEYSKNERVVWGVGWGEEEWKDMDGDGGNEVRRLANFRKMNSILSLSNFSHLSSLYIPLRTPTFDIRGMKLDQRPNWGRNLGRLNLKSMWQSSALLSDGIESFTLGMRLRSKPFTTSHLVSTLNWRRDTPLASLGICLPSPTLDASTASKSFTPIDPIEALLASRGYGSRPSRGERGRIESLTEKSKRGAKEIKANWFDLSDPISSSKSKVKSKDVEESKGGVPNLYNSGIKLQDAQDKQRFEDDRMKPFSQVAMIRGRDGETDQIREQTMGSVNEWNSCGGALGGSYHTSISMPVPSSHPQFFSNLSSSGEPLEPSSNLKLKVRSIPLISSLSISPSLHSSLVSSKKFLTQVIEGHQPLYNYGIGGRGSVGVASSDENDGQVGGRDGLKEIREQLEDLSSNYEMEGFEEQEEEEGAHVKDQDEEWVEKEDEDWDL